MESVRTSRLQIVCNFFVSEMSGSIVSTQMKIIKEIETNTKYKVVGITSDSEPNSMSAAAAGVKVTKDDQCFMMTNQDHYSSSVTVLTI